ncbi:MAG: glutathione S-transferase family protein [Paenirhodobacter sp.]|uniref:glutathione S-transferase family protein n=1 Tax=Paenirhodobacter sp. TaxID=1965326 RepID=UPI003D0DDED9
MITLYHSPNSRSTSVLALLRELGAEEKVTIRRVEIPRADGSGARDPANPHPEGKVPFLTNGADTVRERGAIFTYLCEIFPDAGMAPMPGEEGRGAFLSWMAYYQGVIEPVFVLNMLGLDNPRLQATFRGLPEITEALTAALSQGPWLLGESYSAADLLIASPFLWFPELCPDHPVVRDWVARAGERPSALWAKQRDDA